jgi:hypothetical protein
MQSSTVLAMLGLEKRKQMKAEDLRVFWLMRFNP